MESGKAGHPTFLQELKRRSVMRVALIYVGSAFAVLQGGGVLVEAFGLPRAFLTGIAVILVLGLPLVVALAWAVRIAPEGEVAAGVSREGVAAVGADARAWVAPRTIVVVAALVLIGIVLGFGVRVKRPAESAGVTIDRGMPRLSVALPDSARLAFVGSAALGIGRTALALSPDGKTLAFAGVKSGGGTQLYLRSLDDYRIDPIPGTEGAFAPFFSPDGRWIGFFAQDKLWKVPAAGGAVQPLADAPDPVGGAWWGQDRIVLSILQGAVLRWIAADGGTPTDLSLNTWIVDAPEPLPGGRQLLLGAGSSIYAYSPDTRTLQLILQQGRSPHYVVGLGLVFTRGTDLVVASFDPDRLELRGSAVTIATGVRVEMMGSSQYAVGQEGSVAYVPGRAAAEGMFTWVDRSGTMTPLPFPPGTFAGPRISPDGARLAVKVRDVHNDVWIYGLHTGTRRRLTEAEDGTPAWSLDSRTIFFNSVREGMDRAYSISAEGGAPPLPLAEAGGTHLRVWDVGSDGAILCTRALPRNGNNLWLKVGEENPSFNPLVVADSALVTLTRLSRDGRWVAYTSARTGSSQVYVQSARTASQPVQLSVDGGEEPVWGPDDRELFFRNRQALMAVAVKTGGAHFEAGTPRRLLDLPDWINLPSYSYDISRDGRRFLVARAIEQSTAQEIRILRLSPAPTRR